MDEQLLGVSLEAGNAGSKRYRVNQRRTAVVVVIHRDGENHRTVGIRDCRNKGDATGQRRVDVGAGASEGNGIGTVGRDNAPWRSDGDGAVIDPGFFGIQRHAEVVILAVLLTIYAISTGEILGIGNDDGIAIGR